MKKSASTWQIVAAAALWGTTGTAQALAPAVAQPLAVGALRLVVAAAVLFGFLLWRGTASNMMHMIRASTILAAVCMAAYQVLFFAGVRATGVAVGTVVGIGSAPLIAGLLGFVFQSERLTWRWAAATGLALVGCALLIGARGDMRVDPVGLLLAAGAGAAYATFSLVSKNTLQNQPVERVMAVVFGMSALMLSPLLFLVPIDWLLQPRGFAAILWLGGAATALAYLLFGMGLRRTPLATAVTLSLTEPLVAALLGIFLLGEQITVLGAAGLLLIFSGLWIVSLPGSMPHAPAQEQKPAA